MFATRFSAWKIVALASVAVLGVAAVYPAKSSDAWDLHLAEMEAKLETAWQSRHPGPPLPDACEHDAVHAGSLDVDDSPGAELVIASDRLGMAMFAADGELLAFADPNGCRETPVNWWFNDHFGDGRFNGIVLREETATGEHGCRSSTWVTLLHRRGDTLVELTRYRDQDTDQCRWNGSTGYSVSRSVKKASLGGTSMRGFAVRLRVWEWCSGGSREECESDEPVEYDCTLRGNWVSPNCLPLVGGRPRIGPLASE